MTARLEPCPACSRHARADAAACPFCGIRFSASFGARPAPIPPPPRLGRAELAAYRGLRVAAVGAWALTAPAALAHCSSTSSSTPAPYNIAPAYGAIPALESTASATCEDSGMGYVCSASSTPPGDGGESSDGASSRGDGGA
jgi:hypothetical protein